MNLFSDQAIKALFHCKARLLNWYYKYSQTSDDPYSTSKHTYAWSRHFVKDTLFSSRRSVLANAWTPSWPMQYQSRRVDATPSFLEVASTLRVAKHCKSCQNRSLRWSPSCNYRISNHWKHDNAWMWSKERKKHGDKFSCNENKTLQSIARGHHCKPEQPSSPLVWQPSSCFQ